MQGPSDSVADPRVTDKDCFVTAIALSPSIVFEDMQERASGINGRRLRHSLLEPLRSVMINGYARKLATLWEAGDRQALAAYCIAARARKQRLDHMARQPLSMDMIEDFPAFGGVPTHEPGFAEAPPPPRPTRWFRPKAAPSRGLAFYVHGGGFIAGASPAVTSMVSRLAGRAQIGMMRPSYRLAPEHPCPAAVEDVLESYRWVCENDPGRPVVVVAESCGANIALVMLQQARKQGLPMPKGVLLFSPWIDLTLTRWSMISHSIARKSALNLNLLALSTYLYLQGRSPLDEWANPFSGSFEDFPPILIHASKTDLFRDDAVELAERMKKTNGSLRVRAWLDEGHVWEIYGGLEAERSVDLAAEFIRNCLKG